MLFEIIFKYSLIVAATLIIIMAIPTFICWIIKEIRIDRLAAKAPRYKIFSDSELYVVCQKRGIPLETSIMEDFEDDDGVPYFSLWKYSAGLNKKFTEYEDAKNFMEKIIHYDALERFGYHECHKK